jgi:hypothetical protein
MRVWARGVNGVYFFGGTLIHATTESPTGWTQLDLEDDSAASLLATSGAILESRDTPPGAGLNPSGKVWIPGYGFGPTLIDEDT